MLKDSPSTSPNLSLFGITEQLKQNHPLLVLGRHFDWQALEDEFSCYYSDIGRKGKPIRLMSGLLILKQMYNLSDEHVVEQWLMNPYYQVFCGETEFQTEPPCDPSKLSVFRKRIGAKGVEKIFALSVRLHGERAEEATVLVDTTVQEKAITYPTDSKLAIGVINRLNKLAKRHGIQQRRTYVQEVKLLRLACRFFRHPKRRAQARKALKRLRTIGLTLHRELRRKLPVDILEQEQENLQNYHRALTQQRYDKNKIYSLHEPNVYCVGKGKDHKPYEYGQKASIVMTKESQVIVGAVSHEQLEHDSKLLKPSLEHAQCHRETPIQTAVVDRGYRGSINTVELEVIIPQSPLKRDCQSERKRKSQLCKRRSSIEPVIGHLKHDFRLCKNWLKGSAGDEINLLMAACAWNLRKWLAIFFVFRKDGQFWLFGLEISHRFGKRYVFVRL